MLGRSYIFIAAAWLCLATQSVLADPYFDGGIALFKKNEYKQALPYLSRAMTNNPYDANALYYYSITCQKLGDRKNATTGYARLVSQFPDSQARRLAVAALSVLDPTYCRQLLRPADYLSGSSTGKPTGFTGGSGASSIYDVDPAVTQGRVDFVRRENASSLMEVMGRLNGRDCQFLFDTGASDCCVGKNTLQELNIKLPSGPPTTSVSGVGSKSGTPAWEENLELKVGGITRTIKFVVLENREEPLIGQTFFHDFIYTIDTNVGSNGSRGTISFSKRTGTRSASQTSLSSVPFERLSSNHIIVPVEVDGKKTKMIFDTGATMVVFTREQLKALAIAVPPDAVAIRNTGVSGSSDGLVFNVHRLRMGPIDKVDMQVGVVEDAKMAFPLLGQSFFSEWKYTLDYDRNILNLQKR
ncbi:MAG: retroviral-like aspartic protease family protein [Candidatus Obscuribacterales bacterium]|nr:retroviral-like aspartic protease family protein [Candidatus Obscuribacterales bacterium]